MTIEVIVENGDKPLVTGLITDLPIGGGFLWDGGKLYIRTGPDSTLCPENGAVNRIADFGGASPPWRDVKYVHSAEV